MDRGDSIEIEWVDIYENPTGNPDNPGLSHRKSVGLYWDRKLVEGVPCIITTTTEELNSDDTTSSGYCCYPEVVVKGIEVVKRKRNRRKKKLDKPASTSDTPSVEAQK